MRLGVCWSRGRHRTSSGSALDSILSPRQPGCRPRPCSEPSSTPPASTGSSSAPSAASAPTTTTISSETGTLCPPPRAGEGPQPGLGPAGSASSRRGMSLLFSRQIPGAAGGLQGGGHGASRPYQLEGEEEQGVQRAGEGGGAGVAPEDWLAPPSPTVTTSSCLGLFYLPRERLRLCSSELLSRCPGAPGEGRSGPAPSREWRLPGSPAEGQPPAGRSRRQRGWNTRTRRSACCGRWSRSGVTCTAGRCLPGWDRSRDGAARCPPAHSPHRGQQGQRTRVGTSQHKGFICRTSGVCCFLFFK